MNLLKRSHLIKLLFLFLALILLFGDSSQVAQSQPQCPPGFSFAPSSGVGCVQSNCYDIGFLDYTGHCTCPQDKTGCFEPVDYDSFDINTCTPFCPYSRLISCIEPGGTCPKSGMDQESGVPADQEIDMDALIQIYDEIENLIGTLKPELLMDLYNEWFPDESKDPAYLDEPQVAVDLVDDVNAGFTLALACSEDPLPEDGITCRAVISEGEAAFAYGVSWIMDGYVIKSLTIPAGLDSFSFPNPPPGTHTITVQAVNSTTNTIRVSTALVNVQYAEGTQLKPWLPAAAGAGSVAVLGGWLWAEWLANRNKTITEQEQAEREDENLQKERQAWYEKQMQLNDEVRAKQELVAAQDKLIETEWKRFRKNLLEITDKYHKSDYLVDLYDDMYSDVYKNGKWDPEALVRLQQLIGTHLQMDRQNEAAEEWHRKVQSLQDRQKAFNNITNSWTALGLRLVAGIATSGASEVVWMPTLATGNALYAKERAELLGLQGWDAAKAVISEAGLKLAVDYGFKKAAQLGVKLAGKGASWLLGPERVDQLSKWWQAAMSKLGNAPKPEPKLPVIHQNWGEGPRVFVNQPIYSPGPMPRVDFGMENYLNNHIRPLNNQLAYDIADMYNQGVNLERNLNNLIRPGGGYTISPANEAAIRVLNNPAYKLAVNQGLIPSTAQQFIYQTRDKVCKNAMLEAFSRLDNVLVEGQPASSYIKGVTVTGTGAKPLAPSAIGRWTDHDSTVHAGSTAAEQRAERLFSTSYNQVIQQQGLDAEVAEVNMFPGIHQQQVVPNPQAYTSAPLQHWQKMDMVFRGTAARQLENGTVMFNAHPDVLELPGLGPTSPVPTYPVDPVASVADAGRVISYHSTQYQAVNGVPMTQQQLLVAEGKQALRVWKTINAGSGEQPPAWIMRLQQIKTNPEIQLQPGEVSQLYQQFSDYLHLPSNLGG